MKHLVIGGGSIGKRHLKNLFSLGQNELYCLKRSIDKAFETENHCIVITSNEEAKWLNPDIIYVCNPTSLHHEGLLLAQKTGAHVFMEKPLTDSDQHLQQMIARWQSNRVFYIGFVLRHHPLLKVLKEKIHNKVIGDVFSARFEFGSYLPNWHPGEKVSEGYAGKKSLGGGVINTITHELDLMIDLFGNPESVITAKANLNHLHLDVEELAESIFKYSWGFATLHLDFLQKAYDRQIRILGTEGKIVWNWSENNLSIERFNEPKEIIDARDFNVNQLYIEELLEFLELIRLNKINHSLDFENAVQNTRWMLAMHKSAETEIIWEK